MKYKVPYKDYINSTVEVLPAVHAKLYKKHTFITNNYKKDNYDETPEAENSSSFGNMNIFTCI